MKHLKKNTKRFVWRNRCRFRHKLFYFTKIEISTDNAYLFLLLFAILNYTHFRILFMLLKFQLIYVLILCFF